MRGIMLSRLIILLGMTAGTMISVMDLQAGTDAKRAFGDGKMDINSMSERESMELLRNNLQRVLRWEAVRSNVSPENLLKKVRPDGSLEGVDYRLVLRGSGWQPSRHLSAMSTLAATHPEVAGRMLDFWIKTDSTSTNWWWREIGIPQHVCKTMILLGRKAEKESQVGVILNRSAIGWSSQNKVWLAGIHLMKGLIYGDPEMVRVGREVILSEIQISKPCLGLQPDWSFQMHGAQLQIGNYGLSWFHDMAFWSSVFAGTKYAIPQDRLELVTQFYLRCLRWTLTGTIMDVNACGRQIITSFPENKFRQIRKVAAMLKENGCLKDSDELPSGSICFPCSGYLIHRCSDFFFSVKMCSSRLIGAENCNSENVQGLFSGDGSTMLYPGFRWNPAELALRDWRKVPGTTELENAVPTLKPESPSHNSEGKYCCYAEKNISAAMMQFRNAELQAEKAWFCFGRYIVCMGGEIRAFVSDKPVTTLVQTYRGGPVRLDGKDLPEGETISRGQTSFTFNGMKYLLPERGKFHFLADNRKGDWNTINLELPSVPVSGQMLTVWQEHAPDEAGRYLYVICPENAQLPKLEYLRGNGILGIRSPEGVMIAFFKAGKISGIEKKEPGLYLDFGGIRHFGEKCTR